MGHSIDKYRQVIWLIFGMKTLSSLCFVDNSDRIQGEHFGVMFRANIFFIIQSNA